MSAENYIAKLGLPEGVYKKAEGDEDSMLDSLLHTDWGLFKEYMPDVIRSGVLSSLVAGVPFFLLGHASRASRRDRLREISHIDDLATQIPHFAPTIRQASPELIEELKEEVKDDDELSGALEDMLEKGSSTNKKANEGSIQDAWDDLGLLQQVALAGLPPILGAIGGTMLGRRASGGLSSLSSEKEMAKAKERYQKALQLEGLVSEVLDKRPKYGSHTKEAALGWGSVLTATALGLPTLVAAGLGALGYSKREEIGESLGRWSKAVLPSLLMLNLATGTGGFLWGRHAEKERDAATKQFLKKKEELAKRHVDQMPANVYLSPKKRVYDAPELEKLLKDMRTVDPEHMLEEFERQGLKFE